ncbi:hypothetical protein BC831DRAFT_287199 [Entophlyctis helioformis]|nr:hypothetical protein BC831DRAFT_287199 [Entophlyctis helioformis]
MLLAVHQLGPVTAACDWLGHASWGSAACSSTLIRRSLHPSSMPSSVKTTYIANYAMLSHSSLSSRSSRSLPPTRPSRLLPLRCCPCSRCCPVTNIPDMDGCMSPAASVCIWVGCCPSCCPCCNTDVCDDGKNCWNRCDGRFGCTCIWACECSDFNPEVAGAPLNINI